MRKSVKKRLAIGAVALIVLIVCLSLMFNHADKTPASNGLENVSTRSWQKQYHLGVRYLSDGNYQEAIIAFTAAIEIDPKQTLPYIGRGDAYIGIGENVQNLIAAQTDYEAAIERDETNPYAYLGLADVHIRRGNYDRVMEVFRQALEKTDNAQMIADKLVEVENGDILDSHGNVRRRRAFDTNNIFIWWHDFTYNE